MQAGYSRAEYFNPLHKFVGGRKADLRVVKVYSLHILCKGCVPVPGLLSSSPFKNLKGLRCPGHFQKVHIQYGL